MIDEKPKPFAVPVGNRSLRIANWTFEIGSGNDMAAAAINAAVAAERRDAAAHWSKEVVARYPLGLAFDPMSPGAMIDNIIRAERRAAAEKALREAAKDIWCQCCSDERAVRLWVEARADAVARGEA